jgi:hypothetical protein
MGVGLELASLESARLKKHSESAMHAIARFCADLPVVGLIQRLYPRGERIPAKQSRRTPWESDFEPLF